jgi:hypothetical protein
MLVAGFSPNLTLLPRLILVPGHFEAGHDLTPVAVSLFCDLAPLFCGTSATCVLSSIEVVKRLLASRTPAFLFAREGDKPAEICDVTTSEAERSGS